jgi:zinc transport system substrate-binding protein
MKTKALFLALFCVILFQASAQAKSLVFVSILPQRHFLQRLGGDQLDVRVMVLPGASPATYEPSPGQMAGLAEAEAYFAIGVPFEKTWLERFKGVNPDLEIIQADQDVPKRSMISHDQLEDFGRKQTDAHQGRPDPHIWLSPELVKIQARTICQGLVRIDPDQESFYRANLEAFLQELDQLDARIRSIFETLPEGSRSFMVFHPAWGYFAQAFDLNQIPIESEGKEPGPRQLARIIRLGREQNVSVVFVQPQFSKKSARVIAKEMEARVVSVDPLAEEWGENLLAAARAFKQALGGQGR